MYSLITFFCLGFQHFFGKKKKGKTRNKSKRMNFLLKMRKVAGEAPEVRTSPALNLLRTH